MSSWYCGARIFKGWWKFCLSGWVFVLNDETFRLWSNDNLEKSHKIQLLSVIYTFEKQNSCMQLPREHALWLLNTALLLHSLWVSLSVRNQNTFWKENMTIWFCFCSHSTVKKDSEQTPVSINFLFPRDLEFFHNTKKKQILQILLQNVVLDAFSSRRTILFSLIVFSKKKQWLWICDDKVFCHLADSG